MAGDTYLRFEDDTPPGRKTQVVRVLNTQGVPLGTFQWHGPWRRYVFHPAPDTLFDTACLYEVLRKLGELMQAYRERREAQRTGTRPVL